MLTSIGRRKNERVVSYNEEYTDCLYGQIEMLATREAYLSYGTINTLNNDLKVITTSKQYDEFGLLKFESLNHDTSEKMSKTYEYKRNISNSNQLSTKIASEKIKTNTETIKLSYNYDSRGNVKDISKNDVLHRIYDFDYRGFLTKEEGLPGNQSEFFTYDDNGNIKSKTIKFTDGTEEVISYEYDKEVWGDRLTKFGDKEIKYDGKFMGNPEYFGSFDSNGEFVSGIKFGWIGRDLVRCIDTVNNKSINYTYNDKGLRKKKEVNGVVTNYFYDGNRLITEINGSKRKDFLYDENGMLYGIIYNNTRYFYVRDSLSNIIGIIDTSGNMVVKYDYNAWGKLLSCTGTLASTLGLENSFIYKGYYYDFETGWYYLNSRYYNPEIGRFINADGLIGETGDILGHNMLYSE